MIHSKTRHPSEPQPATVVEPTRVAIYHSLAGYERERRQAGVR